MERDPIRKCADSLAKLNLEIGTFSVIRNFYSIFFPRYGIFPFRKHHINDDENTNQSNAIHDLCIDKNGTIQGSMFSSTDVPLTYRK